MMSELVFPLAALALTFGVLIPMSTLVAKLALVRARRRAVSWASVGSSATFALLVAPTALPLAWLTSSALHQLEPTRTLATCTTSHHANATACFDVVLLLGLIAAAVLGTIWREHLAARPSQRRESRPPRCEESTRRIARIIASTPALAGLRFDVIHDDTAPAYTIGWLRPRVILDACFVRKNDDETLRAVLLHEQAHSSQLDPLRFFVARVCLALDPVGGLLDDELARWRAAREAHCDGVAVGSGGDSLALAQGILCAAKSRCKHASASAPLCGHDHDTIKLRVALLMESPKSPSRSLGHLTLSLMLIAVLVVPHIDDLTALDTFHVEIEHAAHSFATD